MKAGKITAKLRDAVPVCFMVDGKEVKRYKNIELPDELKELEIKDFKFHVPQDEKIVFHLIFDKGVLPEVFPTERPKMTRAAKAAEKVAVQAAPKPEAAVKPITGEVKPTASAKAGTTTESKPAVTAAKPEIKAADPATKPVPEKAAVKEAKPEAAKATPGKDTKSITPTAKVEAEKPAPKASTPEVSKPTPATAAATPAKDTKPDAPPKEDTKK
jgi:hypothetical protein